MICLESPISTVGFVTTAINPCESLECSPQTVLSAGTQYIQVHSDVYKPARIKSEIRTSSSENSYSLLTGRRYPRPKKNTKMLLTWQPPNLVVAEPAAVVAGLAVAAEMRKCWGIIQEVRTEWR